MFKERETGAFAFRLRVNRKPCGALPRYLKTKRLKIDSMVTVKRYRYLSKAFNITNFMRKVIITRKRSLIYLLNISYVGKKWGKGYILFKVLVTGRVVEGLVWERGGNIDGASEPDTSDIVKYNKSFFSFSRQ